MFALKFAASIAARRPQYLQKSITCLSRSTDTSLLVPERRPNEMLLLYGAEPVLVSTAVPFISPYVVSHAPDEACAPNRTQ
jgi:hypothetical protein